jgi:tRNA threonylcarbamoyladenosine biosynthesis protein TsaE
MTEYVVRGADEMREFGARLARALLTAPAHESLLVTLSGDLGAGKTTLVSGLLAELGHAGPVRSPTYTLLEPYRLQGRDITHCDLYRLRHPDELDDLGLRDLRLAGSVLLVEWPEKAEGRLNAVDLSLAFDYAGPDARTLVAAAHSPVGKAVLSRL